MGTIFLRRWSVRRSEWIPDTDSVDGGQYDFAVQRLSTGRVQVSVGIVIKDGHVLLVRRREKEAGALQWQFPGGVIRLEESDKEVAEREVLQEASIVCRATAKIGERVHPDTQAYVHYWLCDYISGSPKVKDLKDLDRAEWVAKEDAFRLITSDVYAQVRRFVN